MQNLPFAQLWLERRNQTGDEALRFWEARADEFNDITNSADRAERLELVDWLEERGAFLSGFRVLDVGCGAGRFALEMARRGAEVVGVDLSPGMVRHAENNARAAGLAGCRFSAVPWEDLDIDASGYRGAFDLVFASMSGAVYSAETLLKMHDCSRRYCFMSGFIKRRDTLKEKIGALLSPPLAVPPHNGSMHYAFNVLWQHNIYADFLCRETQWSNTWSADLAVKTFGPEFAKLSGREESELVEKLRTIVGPLAVDGTLTREVRAKVAWMFWEKGDEQECPPA